MDTFEKVMLIIVLGTFIFIPIYAYVLHLICKKKMESGVDKRKLQYILQDVVKGEDCYIAAYAYWVRMDSFRWGNIRNSWYYAIGFNDNRIYVVPLMFEEGEIYYRDFFCFEKTMVAKIESSAEYGRIKLFDRNGQLLAHLQVNEKNNSSHGNGEINLYQEQEFKAFQEWITRWTAEINMKGTNAAVEKTNVATIETKQTASLNEAKDVMKNGYTDILQHTKRINDEDKKEIFKLLDAGHKAEAARLIQARSGLGIVDVMKVAENPYMYL